MAEQAGPRRCEAPSAGVALCSRAVDVALAGKNTEGEEALHAFLESIGHGGAA